MADDNLTALEDYIIILRLIQPARIQDIKRMYSEVLGFPLTEAKSAMLDSLHARMREEERVIPVRKGTYVLNKQGMDIAGKLMKPRALDNARIFLMKSQRKVYH